MEDLKVFQVCDEDWVCARSQQEAVEWYLKETGVAEDDIYPLDMIVEAHLDLNDVYMDEEMTRKVTFREAIKENISNGMTVPYIICSTEY